MDSQDIEELQNIANDLGFDGNRSGGGSVIGDGGSESSGGSTTSDDEEGDEEEMNYSDATRFRSVCARLNFLAQDRAELQFTSKEISSSMARPLVGATKQLKRVARFLRGHGRAVQAFPWEEQVDTVEAFADSDWAGNRKSAKSTSGGVLRWGGACLKDVVIHPSNNCFVVGRS